MSYTRQELADKIEWEGGVWEALCGYGMNEMCLPDDTPPEVVEAWKRVRATERDVQVISDWLDGAFS